MRDLMFMLMGIVLTVMLIVGVVTYRKVGTRYVYEPNGPMYKYIHVPPPEWTKAFGNNRNARVAYALSDLRIQQAGLRKTVAEMKAQLYPDPNGAGITDEVTP